MSHDAARELLAEIERLASRCDALEVQRVTLGEQLSRCAEGNVALRESALMWIALYERQLNRANSLAEALVHRP
jgi:hypothetical protein